MAASDREEWRLYSACTHHPRLALAPLLTYRIYRRSAPVRTGISGPRGADRRSGKQDREGGRRARYPDAEAVRVCGGASKRCKSGWAARTASRWLLLPLSLSWQPTTRADLQYLANLAHELNSQPLPPLPESFEVVRLPPPSQRLTEVTFDLVPTAAAGLLTDDEMRSESDSDSESDDDADGELEKEDADGEEDDDMEEVVPQQAAPEQQEREVDEDYDA